MPGKINFNPDLSKPFKPPRKLRGARIEPPSKPIPTQQAPETAGPGIVQGKRATDIEHNFFIAANADAEVTYIEFLPQYIAARGLPGGLQLDYLIGVSSIMYPFFLDGEYWHRDAAAQEEARREVALVNKRLDGTGAYPAQRIPGADLATIPLAKIALKRGLSGYYVGLYI